MWALKTVAFLLLVGAIAYIWLQIDIEMITDRERIQKIVEDNFWRASLLYIAMFMAVKLSFVPGVPMSAIGGYAFGAFWGTFFAAFAFTIVSVFMFLMARFLGERFTRKVIENKFQSLAKYNDQLQRHGLLTVIFLRIVPTVPLGVLNFGLGITKVRTMDYILGTIIGTIPGNALLAGIGANADNLYSWQFISLVLVYLCFLVATGWYANHKRQT